MKLSRNSFLYRVIILIVLLLVFFSVCTIRLFEFCVVNGEEYYLKSQNNKINNITIPAARGNIVDRNGKIMATTSVVFSIVLDYNFLPKDKQNDVLLNLIKLMEKNNIIYTDELPISKYTPFEYNSDSTTQVEPMLKSMRLNVYASANDAFLEGVKKYKLESYDEKYQRKLLGVRYSMELKEFSRYTRFTIASDIEPTMVALIKELSNELPGIFVEEQPKRIYKSGDIASHVIGSVGPIYAEEYAELKEKGYKMNSIIGKSGVEKEFESYLQGTNGTMQIVQGPDGEIIKSTIIKEPKAGNTISLTIDMDLQEKVQDLLGEHIKWYNTSQNPTIKSKGGASVVLDAKTGEILACANQPNYDINDYSKNYSSLLKKEGNPLFNRALFGLYRPGSTFKTIVGSAGLAESVINPDSLINCTGTYLFFGDYRPSCLRHGHAGNININNALKWSCNIFFYDVGRQLDIDRINEYANSYGLATDTGIEIPSKIGNLSSPEYSKGFGSVWTPGNVIQAAIGQMDTNVTPLQMATQAMTIANKGVRYETHIIKDIKSYDGKTTVFKTSPIVAQKTKISESDANAVIEGMVSASSIIYGEYSLLDYPYKVAVKTGTPQVGNDRYNNTFIAFAPAHNPEIAFTVMQEDGDNTNRMIKQIIDAYNEVKNK